MKSLFAFAAAAMFFLAPPFVSAQTTRAVEQVERVLIITIDGLRPDVLLRAEAPRLRAMCDRGCFTFWARSTHVSMTLPTHVSIMTGVPPERHSITWNRDLAFSTPVYPSWPTLFEVAKSHGLSTAMITGKSKLAILDKPGSIDFKFIPDDPKCEDAEVTANALRILREHRPDVAFIHLPGVDNVGHAKGWGTREQLAAVTEADRRLGEILDALDELKLSESTVVILTSDHGGAGKTHGPDDARSRHVPWIVVGPGVRRNFDLTLHADVQVESYDTFATACAMLGIEPSRAVSGKFVAAILEKDETPELLRPISKPAASVVGDAR